MRVLSTVIFVSCAILLVPACSEDEFVPGDWYWFTSPEPDFTGKVIVARDYRGSMSSCVTNFSILAQELGGTKAKLDYPAKYGAAPMPVRYVYDYGKEIADIGCNKEGFQTVTATPEVARRLNPKKKSK